MLIYIEIVMYLSYFCNYYVNGSKTVAADCV